jgi:hypothetical protein
MSIFLFLPAVEAFDRCESTDGCLGFLNLFSRDVVSLTMGVEGADCSDGDGLGRCVF